MLSDLAGPRAEPFDLHLVAPDGTRQDGARIIQVSNNPYRLTSFAGFGSRAHLDTGKLGVATVELRGARDIVGFLAAAVDGPPRPVPRLEALGDRHAHDRVEPTDRGGGGRGGLAVRPAARAP